MTKIPPSLGNPVPINLQPGPLGVTIIAREGYGMEVTVVSDSSQLFHIIHPGDYIVEFNNCNLLHSTIEQFKQLVVESTDRPMRTLSFRLNLSRLSNNNNLCMGNPMFYNGLNTSNGNIMNNPMQMINYYNNYNNNNNVPMQNTFMQDINAMASYQQFISQMPQQQQQHPLPYPQITSNIGMHNHNGNNNNINNSGGDTLAGANGMNTTIPTSNQNSVVTHVPTVPINNVNNTTDTTTTTTTNNDNSNNDNDDNNNETETNQVEIQYTNLSNVSNQSSLPTTIQNETNVKQNKNILPKDTSTSKPQEEVQLSKQSKNLESNITENKVSEQSRESSIMTENEVSEQSTSRTQPKHVRPMAQCQPHSPSSDKESTQKIKTTSTKNKDGGMKQNKSSTKQKTNDTSTTLSTTIFDSCYKCDICDMHDGYREMYMQKCKTCGIYVHEECYGLLNEDYKKTKFLKWECWACLCKLINTTVEMY